jgi:cytochrome P450
MHFYSLVLLWDKTNKGQDIKQQVEDILEGRNEKHKDASHPTILKELIDSNLPPQEKSMQRLQHEGQVIVGAGLETVKWTMCVALFHVLDKLEIEQRLDAELLQAWPDLDNPPKLAELERLPYLTAVIQECRSSLSFLLGSCVDLDSTSPLLRRSVPPPSHIPYTHPI